MTPKIDLDALAQVLDDRRAAQRVRDGRLAERGRCAARLAELDASLAQAEAEVARQEALVARVLDGREVGPSVVRSLP